MKNPSLDYPIQVMIDEQTALEAQLAFMTAAHPFLAETKERLAACRLAQQILNLYAIHQTQPLQTHEVPRLSQ